MSIKKKVFLYIISVYLFIAIGIYIYFSASIIKNYRNYELDNAIAQTSQLKANFEIPFQGVFNLQALLENNSEILSLMKQEQSMTIEQKVTIESFLKYASSFQKVVKGIYLVDNNGNFCTSDWQVNESLFKEYIAAENVNSINEPMYSAVHNSNAYQIFSSVSVISYIIPIYNKLGGDNRTRIGTVFIDVNFDMLSEIFIKAAILSDEKILIAHPNNDILYKYPYQTDFSNIIEDHPNIFDEGNVQFFSKIFGEDSLVISNNLTYYNWKLIQIVDLNRIYVMSNRIKQFTLIFFIIILIIGAIIANSISDLITNPIIKLNKTMKYVDQGNLDVSINNNRHDEIGELINSFNSMVVKLDDSFKKSILSEKRKTQLEFRILQEQINPHFLYNTLDSIKWLAVIQNVENISDMATSLITLLKYNSERGQLQVPLTQEVNALKAYVRIQQNRYGDMINVVYNVAPETAELRVIKFILQPIVENSILHAFEGYEDDNTITVSTKIENKKLLLTIEDNGIGFDTSKKKEEEQKTKNSFPLHKGIGIDNTFERIKLYYGDEYGIQVSSEIGVGTKVILMLPCISDDIKNI